MNLVDENIYKNLIPVQIIGTQRSGSNLLRLMLNQIQEVIALHPPHILKTFTPIIDYYGDLSIENNFRQLIQDVCEFIKLNAVPWKNAVLDPDLIFNQCEDRSLLEVYRKIYEVNAMHKGKRVWVNKSMQNVYYIDFFEKNGFFPLLIHLVRDGRDVSLSFKRTIIGEKHIYHLARQWRNDQDISDYYVDKYGPGQAIRVKYEDLLVEPTNQMKRICAFLNVPYTDKVFKFYTSDESLLTASSGEMWVNLVKPIIKNNFNKYKKGLDRWEIEIFEMIAGDLLEKYGYQLEHNINSRNFSFSEDMIRQFNQDNEFLKTEILKDASPPELQAQFRQQQLIQSIKERMNIL